MPESIRFIRNEVRFRMNGAKGIPNWLRSIAKKEGSEIGELTYIFCTDDFLLDLNRLHLGHDYYTDIITFDLSSVFDRPAGSTWNNGRGTRRSDLSLKSRLRPKIQGEIYISVDRVRENAVGFGVTFQNELLRVMSHGLLHLLGYKDKSKMDKVRMREKEEECLKKILGSTWNKGSRSLRLRSGSGGFEGE